VERTVPVKWEEANGQARKAPRVWGPGRSPIEGCLPSQAIGYLTNHEIDVAVSNRAKAGYGDVMQDQGLPRRLIAGSPRNASQSSVSASFGELAGGVGDDYAEDRRISLIPLYRRYYLQITNQRMCLPTLLLWYRKGVGRKRASSVWLQCFGINTPDRRIVAHSQSVHGSLRRLAIIVGGCEESRRCVLRLARIPCRCPCYWGLRYTR
jgi:hypothetical protein